MSKSSIRKDIQGLRGISVASVVLYHAWPRLVPGGFVGVDVFFVISGFVITRTILRDFSAGRFSIAQFYRRRVRRIFPALYAVLAFVLAASWFLLPPLDFLELGKSAFAAIFFSSNIFFLLHSNYFDGLAGLRPLLHTWSLSVEEQFYVFFPLLVVLVQRYFARLLRPALVLLSIASLALAAGMLHDYPNATFYLAPPRAFELLLGALVACPGSRPNLPRRIRDGLSLLGLCMIVIAFAIFSSSTPFPGPAALLPCLGAAMIIRAGAGDEEAASMAGRLLSTRPFTFFGDVSYSLYLWHWPLFVLARHAYGSSLGLPVTCVCIFLAVLASWLSLRFVERPLLDKRNDNLPFLKIGLGAMALASLPCLLLVHSKGVPRRFSSSSLALFSASGDFNHRRVSCHGEDATPIPYDRNCSFGSEDAPPDAAVWGDSHGAEMTAALGELLGSEGRAAMEITASHCPPAANYNAKGYLHCAAHNRETLARLISDQRIKTVIVTANFSAYKDDGFDSMLAGYRGAVTQLRAAGKHVILIYPIPTYDFNPPEALGIRNQHGAGLDTVGKTLQTYRDDNEQAIHLLDSIYSMGGFDRVVPQDILCDANWCKTWSAENGVLYYNGDHLSMAGARLIANRILPDLPAVTPVPSK